MRDIVPLCELAHKLVHLWLFWNTPVRCVVNWLLRLLMVFSLFFWRVIWVVKQLTKLTN
ncbi:asr7060 (plasmid) [Nostoc sp. PCC 7120 = FACHB-418]|nr:asr7060 [Nostoc sp. PCC 7120 = FACHB-418]